MPAVIVFGGPGLGPLGGVRIAHRRQRATVEDAARRGLVSAVIIDARAPEDFVRGQELLRALFDNPRQPKPALAPGRILALIGTGEVEAAFAFGRFGIAGVLEAHRRCELAWRLEQMLASEPKREPIIAPQRPTLLSGRPPDELPIVTIGYRHDPRTLAGLERYCIGLREHAEHSTVFADAAMLIELLVGEGLTCQTNLASKAGVTHTGQFIGSFSYYRELRHTRYANIPEHPTGALAMEVFVAIDEILHEVLHLLFMANELRAGIEARHPLLAEELSLSWWQGVLHNRVFPDWICDRHILEINDDFALCEDKQHSWEFWKIGSVFDQYAHYPWVRWLLAQLPERASYIGQRADLDQLIASFERKPEAAFLRPRAAELRLAVPFDSYPTLPAGLAMSG
jgi:hypothetical protein